MGFGGTKKFFEDKKNYNFFDVLEKTFLSYGFSPKNCMIRPFNLFSNTCRLDRASEYRHFISKIYIVIINTVM